jgi:hypothetical protein
MQSAKVVVLGQGAAVNSQNCVNSAEPPTSEPVSGK